MQLSPAENLINVVTNWARTQPGISGLLLAGSYVHGTARPDSDIDLVLLAPDSSPWLERREWLNQFGDVERINLEDWVGVKTQRAFFAGSLELEFNFAPLSLASTNPVDPSTFRVVADGVKILLDPEGALNRLVEAVELTKAKQNFFNSWQCAEE